MTAVHRLPLFAFLFWHAGYVMAQSPGETMPAELAAIRTWADASFGEPKLVPSDRATRDGLVANRLNVPLSFVYGGQSSDALIPVWQRTHKSESIAGGTRESLSYRDPKTGLLVEIELTRYSDAAALDWVCWLSNTGVTDTPIIEELMPLDAALLPADPGRGSPTLRWSNGDGCTESSFLPHDEPLAPGSHREFAATSSDTTCLPFFNLRTANAGWIVAVGWTGRWKCGFLHEPSGAIRVSAGMQATHFRLKPGERVRTPRIVVLRYGGTRLIDGHNAFRRLMLAHYVPKEGHKPAMPPVATNTVAGLWLRSAHAKKPLGLLNEASELTWISQAAAIGCEAYWMDAYWFPQPWYQGNIGNWYPRQDDFPHGLRAGRRCSRACAEIHLVVRPSAREPGNAMGPGVSAIRAWRRRESRRGMETGRPRRAAVARRLALRPAPSMGLRRLP